MIHMQTKVLNLKIIQFIILHVTKVPLYARKDYVEKSDVSTKNKFPQHFLFATFNATLI